jgi:hypothetical protein
LHFLEKQIGYQSPQPGVLKFKLSKALTGSKFFSKSSNLAGLGRARVVGSQFAPTM